MSSLYREPFKDASYQVLIHLAKWFQRRRFFRNQPIRNKNGLWWPCFLTDRDEMSSLYRGPSIDASYRPIRNKNCLWRPCLLMDRDKMSNLYKEPSIDASYQVSVHLAEGFQEEKIKMWKVNGRQTMDDRRRTPSDGKSSHCLWQGELKKDKQFYKTTGLYVQIKETLKG